MEEKLNKIVEMLSLVTTRLDKVESNISTNKVNSPVTNLEQRINVEDVEDRSTSTINTFRSKDLIPTIIDKKNEESSTAKLKKLLAIKHQEVNQEVNLFEQLEISGSDNNCGAQSILTAYKNQYERKFPSGRSTGPIAIRKLLANAVSKSTMIQATVFEDKAAYIRRDLSSSEKLNAYIDLITNPVNANSTGYRLTDYEMEVLAEVNKLNIVIINDRKDKDIYPATRSFNGGIDNPIITFIYNINSNHYNVLYIKAFCQYEERAQIKIIGSAQRNKDLLFADNKYYIVNFSSDNPFPNALHKDLLQETPERLETDDFPLHSVYKDNDNDDDGDQMFTVTKKDLERLLLAKKRNGNGIQAGVNTFVPLLLDTGVERSNTGIARTPFAAFNSIPPLYSSRTSRPKEADVDRTLGSTKKQMQDHMSDLEKLKEIQGKRSKDKHTTPFDSDDSTSSTSSSSINDSSSTSSSSRSKKSKKNKKKKDRRRRNQRATIIRRQINLVEAKLLYEADNMTFNEVADHLRKINDFRNDPSNKGADFLIFSTIASENLRELIFNKCYEHFKKKLGKRHPTIASELVKLSDEDFVEALWFYSAPTSISKAIKVLRDVPLKISNKVTMENYRMSASNFEKFMAFATAYMNRFEHVYKQLGTYCDPTSVPRSFQVPATKGERLSGAINILMDSMHQICPWFTNYYNNMQEEVKRSIRNKLSLSEFCELFKSIIVKVHAVMKEASKYIQYGYNNEDKPPSRLSILQRDPSRRVSFEQEEMPGLNDIDEEIELEGGFDMTDAFYNIDPIRNERKSISGLTLYQPPSKTTRFEAKDKGDAYYAGKPCFKQDKCPGKDNGSCKFNHDKDFYKKYMDDLSKIQKRPSLSYIEQVFNHIRETGTADLDDLDTEVLMGIINHAKKLSPAHILTKVVSTEDDELQAREDSEDGRQG